VLVIGAVVGSVALGGCGAGQVAQTAFQANSSGGATVTTNGIAIRDAQIAYTGPVQRANVYTAGGSAPIEMHIVNQSTQNDRLVSASSPVAGSVQISGQTDLPAGVAMVVGGSFGTSGQTLPGQTEPPAKPRLDTGLPGPNPNSPTAPSSAAQEPPDVSPTGSASSTGEAPAVGLQTPAPIAAVDPSTRFTQVVMVGLREDIRPGLAYELDLNFQRAGQVRLQLPVAYPGQPRQAAEGG
jgi:copper(I)-binding protein